MISTICLLANCFGMRQVCVCLQSPPSSPSSLGSRKSSMCSISSINSSSSGSNKSHSPSHHLRHSRASSQVTNTYKHHTNTNHNRLLRETSLHVPNIVCSPLLLKYISMLSIYVCEDDVRMLVLSMYVLVCIYALKEIVLKYRSMNSSTFYVYWMPPKPLIVLIMLSCLRS